MNAARATELLRRTALGVLLLGVAGCAPALVPAVIERTLDGWAFLTTDTVGASVLVGSSSAKLCEDVRRSAVRVNEPFPVRCQYVRLDMNPLSPNFHLAVGSQPQGGVLVFIGGPTQGDCDRLRAGARSYRWSAVPCRPVMLIER
jgi:hypothetical protein